MEKRFEKIFLISFAIFAVGLGFWGYARVGSGYTAGAACTTFSGSTVATRPNGLEAVRCVISPPSDFSGSMTCFSLARIPGN